MTLNIEIEFEIGEAVEYRDKRGMDSGFVTGLSIRQGNQVSYGVSWSDKSEKYHYAFELKKSNNGKN